MATDIATQTARVGNALSSVRLDEMLTNLAKGLAWGQYDLDKVGIDVARMMGVPGAVNVGGDSISMLEAGFLPSFYQFVDTILELKMEVKIREEETRHLGVKDASARSEESESGGEASTSARAGLFFGSFEAGAKTNWQNRSKSAYSRTIDTAHAQRYNQELNASSLMRTKLVPRPPPELLVERIRAVLEQMRKEAEVEARQEAEGGSTADIDARMLTILMEKIERKLLGRVDEIGNTTG